MSERHYYMVRAMLSDEKDFDVFFQNNVVAVGWSKVNFTEYSDNNELRKAVRREYYKSVTLAPQQTSRNLNEVVRFKDIKKDDYIVVPYYSNIVLAVADDDEVFSAAAIERDLSNQRKVTFRYSDTSILKIPRNELTEGLQRRLRVRGTTVANLFEFKDEIEKLFTRKAYSYSQDMQYREQEERTTLKKGLLENIRQGKTNLRTGGIGLENLVCELMKCEGYDAKVLPKTKFAGKADADVRALKEDAFSSQQIFVQVKHHSGYSGKAGIQQVIDVLAQDEYQDYRGFFITSADVDDETCKFANDHGIEVMDGNGLSELIISNLNKLSGTTLRLLGISPYPHIM